MADEDAEREAEEREFYERLEAELKRLSVSDVLLQSVVTVSSLGLRRLTAEERDLDQARLAIEALRVLVPILAESVPAETIRELEQMIANLQLAYAKAVSEGKETDGGG